MLVDYHNCIVYLLEGETPAAGRGPRAARVRGLRPPRVPARRGAHRPRRRDRQADARRQRPRVRALQAADGGTPATSRSPRCPCGTGSALIGAITMSKLGVGQFDDDDLRLLEVVAGHASVALENARLYESARREAENATAWLEFSDARLRGALGRGYRRARPFRTIARLMEVDAGLDLDRGRRGGQLPLPRVARLLDDDPRAAAVPGLRDGAGRPPRA